MKIKLNSVMVDDQNKALRFYTQILGFVASKDIPVTPEFRWLTVVSPEGHADVELTLEPNAFPFAKTYQEALLRNAVPATAFAVDDIHAEYRRLKDLGVVFTTAPTRAGPVTVAVFADTCGNLIQIYEE